MRDERGVLVGPHRVWLPERGYPGLAMSRAIGDGLASLCAPLALPVPSVIGRGCSCLAMSCNMSKGMASLCGFCGCMCSARAARHQCPGRIMLHGCRCHMSRACASASCSALGARWALLLLASGGASNVSSPAGSGTDPGSPRGRVNVTAEPEYSAVDLTP